MLREAINAVLVERGISQVSICTSVDILPQNLNAFIRGKRSIPLDNVVSIMEKLGLTIGAKMMKRGVFPINEVRQIISDHIQVQGLNTSKVSAQCHVHTSTLTRFLNGVEPVSSRALEKILIGLNMKVLPYSQFK